MRSSRDHAVSLHKQRIECIVTRTFLYLPGTKKPEDTPKVCSPEADRDTTLSSGRRWGPCIPQIYNSGIRTGTSNPDTRVTGSQPKMLNGMSTRSWHRWTTLRKWSYTPREDWKPVMKVSRYHPIHGVVTPTTGSPHDKSTWLSQGNKGRKIYKFLKT